MSAKKKTPILVVVLGLIAIAAIAFHLSRPDDISPGKIKKVWGVSLASHEDVYLEVPYLGDPPPYADPETGEVCVYPWFFDPSNGKRFIPQLVKQADGPPKLPMIPMNPATGQSGFQWIPDLYEEDYNGDEKLPEWPLK